MKEARTETLKLTFDGTLLTCTLLKDVELNVSHVVANHLASEEITEGKKFICLVITTPQTSITFAAQRESMTREKYKNVVAQAVVIHSMAQRVLGNFMIKFLKHPSPVQLFSTKEEAVAWLYQEWEKE